MSNKSMKVAIVAGINSDLDSLRGIGIHTSELVKALGRYKDIKILSDPRSADVVHYTKFNPFFISLPFFKPKNTKFVLTIHDLIPLIYPAHYPSGIKGKIRFLINKYLIWKNVDKILTISETSKKDICRFLGVNPEMVKVIYLAPKKIFFKKTSLNIFNLPRRFALYTGDINYNKNIPNLVKACEIAKIPLVIAGKQALEIEKMDLNHPEISHLAGVSFRDVIRLGFVSDEDLNKLYNLATVYIQPSLYEGFGFTPLEAVACGTPLVVTKTQALVEILGEDLDYVDPNDPEDMARGILNPNRNIKLPRVYSWEKTAKETLEIYV